MQQLGMESPILHINPEELNDVVSLRLALIHTLNIVDSLVKQRNEDKKVIQELRDEINRLKGEQGKPIILPNKRPDISSTKHYQEHKPWNKQPKKHIIPIDNKVICSVNRATIPSDAVFKEYKTVIQQDIIFKRNNTEYQIEVWYSPSEHKTYCGDYPESTGYFGGNLRAFCMMMSYGLDVTRNKLLDFIHSFGIEMSVGSLENILTADKEKWLMEKDDLLKAGLHGSYLQTDSTGARVNGHTHRTHVLVSEFFAVFATMPGKSRLDILRAFQGQPQDDLLVQYNSIAQEYLEHYKISPEYRNQIEILFQEKSIMGIKEFNAICRKQMPKLIRKATTYKWIMESLAFGYFFEQTTYPAPNVLISDDAKEYALLAPLRMLCWVHDARFYNKLTPLMDIHRNELEKFKTRYWEFYGLLKQYKQNPSQKFKCRIDEKFDELFTTSTSYFDLNKEIERTYSNKKMLLTVLDHPEIPLHNNAAELGARRGVRKRDISLHTMTDLGTQLVDAFMSILHTSKLLGVNVYQYILSRINNCSEFYLPDLVIERINLEQGK